MSHNHVTGLECGCFIVVTQTQLPIIFPTAPHPSLPIHNLQIIESCVARRKRSDWRDAVNFLWCISVLGVSQSQLAKLVASTSENIPCIVQKHSIIRIPSSNSHYSRKIVVFLWQVDLGCGPAPIPLSYSVHKPKRCLAHPQTLTNSLLLPSL